ncbi:NUDIX hydrolase [Micromonospora sp. NPDC051925]|uniref:NUDIX hydrolase n=1 Tax=Micromonospora sp. NPDC051925 TaxID=3364288 RepID=UPI0037CC4716
MQTAGVVLVRSDGSLLLQLRDDHAPTDANRWGIPGGLAEPGETPEAAARRELLEETGLQVHEPLHLFWSGVTADGRHTAHVYYATTDADASDIVVGEGRAMVFVPADAVAQLDLAANARPVLRDFLTSKQYQTMLTIRAVRPAHQ